MLHHFLSEAMNFTVAFSVALVFCGAVIKGSEWIDRKSNPDEQA